MHTMEGYTIVGNSGPNIEKWMDTEDRVLNKKVKNKMKCITHY